MVLIQAAAAVLLLLGSALIFWALFEIDAPTRPRPNVRPFRRPQAEEPEVRLPRAA